MNIACQFCGALHWKAESSSSSPGDEYIFESCCKKGSVVLDPLPNPPAVLHNLLSSNESYAKHFRSKIRSYNAASPTHPSPTLQTHDFTPKNVHIFSSYKGLST